MTRALVLGLICALATPVTSTASGGRLTNLTNDPCQGGSSAATFYSSNRRLALTEKGRLLAVYDPHGSGVQLKYLEAGGSSWKSNTTGQTSDGFFTPTDGPNDRTASIDIAPDRTGRRYAWVVWGGYDFGRPSAVRMRRLGRLDSSAGPAVGPEATLVPEGLGNNRVDFAIEKRRRGRRGVVTYLRRTGENSYELVVAYLSRLDSPTPSLIGKTVLYRGSNSHATATLVATRSGMRVVARTDRLRLWMHNRSDPLTAWRRARASTSAPEASTPSAVASRSGSILAAFDSDPGSRVVKVVRFRPDGSSMRTLLKTGSGFRQPSIATDGTTTSLVMIRVSDDAVVSRQRFDGSWSGHRVLIGPEGGGDYAWPNAMRSTRDGRLRVLVDGARCPKSTERNEVLHFQARS